MLLLNWPTLVMLSAALVTGCDLVGKWDHLAAGEANSADDAARKTKEDGAIMDVDGNYAVVNGLRMYYELHGSGSPLVLLHGAFGWATTYPTLAKGRRTIAVELQGHGHTADVDRPLSFDQMADDTAALLRGLKVGQADVFGYSMGGNVGLAMAIRHPGLVRKLAINGAHAGPMADAYDPAALEQFRGLPADFAPPLLKEPYDRVAPDPGRWPTLVAKIKAMGLDFPGFAPADLEAIRAPVLITIGDRDGVRVEHAVAMYRKIPKAQLAVFPGADHFLIWQDPEAMLPTIAAFLDAPMPGPNRPSGR